MIWPAMLVPFLRELLFVHFETRQMRGMAIDPLDLAVYAASQTKLERRTLPRTSKVMFPIKTCSSHSCDTTRIRFSWK